MFRLALKEYWRETDVKEKLIYLYILFVPLMFFPIKYKIQISELIFIPLFLVWIFGLLKFGLRNIKIPFGFSLMVYFSVSLLSMVNSTSFKHSLLELLINIYLAAMYVVFVNLIDHKDKLKKAIKCFIFSLFLVVAWGLVSLSVSYSFGSGSLYVQEIPDYPYLGHIFRPLSTMQNAKLLGAFLIVSIGILFGYILAKEEKRQSATCLKILASAVIILAVISVSRTLFSFLVCLFVISCFRWRSNKQRVMQAIISIVLLIAFVGLNIIATYHIFGVEIEQQKIHLGDEIIPSRPVFFPEPGNKISRTNIAIRHTYTTYWKIKQAALVMIRRHPILGVGIGAFNDNVKLLVQENKLPQNFPAFDPHSTFLGRFAECGILGLASLLLLLIAIFKNILSTLKTIRDRELRWIQAGIFADFIALIVQGINMDIMNFRFFWLLIAFAAVIKLISDKKEVLK